MSDPQATQLMLETLIVIRAKVDDIHSAILGEDDDEEAPEEDA
jgi:hypothetical protein